jgi:hypothetical protein
MRCQRVIRVGDYGRLCKFPAREEFETCTLHRHDPGIYHYRLRSKHYQPNQRPIVSKIRGKNEKWFSGPAAYAYPPKNWFVVGKLDMVED